MSGQRLPPLAPAISGGSLAERELTTMSNKAEKQGIAQAVTTGALVASAGLAGYGVLGVYGVDTPLAAAGSAAFASVVVLSEVGASRLLVYAQAAIDTGRKIGAGAIVAGFAALTVCNVAAGHMGLTALDGAITASKAAPLIAAHATAKANADAADEALRAFDDRENAKATNLAVGLKGAMASGYVSAAARALKTDPEAEARADALRDEKATKKAEAKAALERAEMALQSAPKSRPDWQLWAFAAMLELLKGAFQWFAALGAARAASKIAEAPKGVESILEIDAADFDAVPPEQRAQYISKLRSLATSLQHKRPKLSVVGK